MRGLVWLCLCLTPPLVRSVVFVVPANHSGWEMGVDKDGRLAAYRNDFEYKENVLFAATQTADGLEHDELQARCAIDLDCTGFRSTGDNPPTGLLYLGNGPSVATLPIETPKTGIVSISFDFEPSPVPDLYLQRTLYYDGARANITFQDESELILTAGGTHVLANVTAALAIYIDTTARSIRTPLLDPSTNTPPDDNTRTLRLMVDMSLLLIVVTSAFLLKRYS